MLDLTLYPIIGTMQPHPELYGPGFFNPKMLETLIVLYFLFARNPEPGALGASSVVLASRSFSMENRYDVPSVNTVFKDNILLALNYMDGRVKSKAEIDWGEVIKPFHSEFTLKPGEKFAFHDNTLPEYSENVAKTTNSRYMSYEGFKSDGWLVGDGVCHLASLINWAAQDAGLDVYVPVRHDFAKINDVPKEYGVSINSNKQYGNLYITNSKEVPVIFAFDFDGSTLTVSVVEAKT